jgi:hypothetical protein
MHSKTTLLLLLLLSAQAVLQLNLCRVLQDPAGEQMRPLVVRRANAHDSFFPLPKHKML